MENIDLVNQIKSIFDPIAKLIEASELRLVQHNYTELSFGYKSYNIGIEISIDLSYFFIFVLIFKVKGNEIPVGYEDEIGDIQKIYIQKALKKLGVDIARESSELQKLGGDYRNYLLMSNIYSKLLEDNWDNIKSNINIIFQKL